MVKKSLVLLICSIILLPCSWADDEYRVFTGTDGRVIEAKIVSCDARSGQVTMERADHRKVTVPVTLFSEADQAYIAEWVAAQDFMSNSRLRISVQKKKGSTGDDKSQVKRPKPPCYYEISLENRASTALEGIWVEYCTYMTHEKMSGGKDQVTVNHAKLPDFTLHPQKKHTAQTKEVKLFRYYESQLDISYDSYGYVTRSTSYNKTAEDNMEGVRVRVFFKTPSGTVFTREICEPGSVENAYPWKK